MSCLFDTLATFIPGIDSSTLRHMICQYLKRDPVIFDDMRVSSIMPIEDIQNKSLIRTLEEYVDWMSQITTWGGAVEIKCYCDIFLESVCVEHANKTIEFYPRKSHEVTGIVRCIKYNGRHYDV